MDKTKFDKELDGKRIALYELSNAHGMTVYITNYGAKIVSVNVPDRQGQLADVVLGFDTIDDYLAKEPFFGAICGRFANRIKDGKFTLDGKQYQLAINNGTNHLHGGNIGFNQKVWDVLEVSETSLKLQYISADGEENYPGTLTTVVTYAITEDNALSIHYEATTDKPTIAGFTNHAYFNLKGAGEGDIRDHVLQLNADFYTEIDDTQSPTGEIKSVTGTPMDYRNAQAIGERIDDPFFAIGRGLDNNWIINKAQQGDCALAGSVSAANRTMEVYTTLPGIQVYTGNWVEQNVGKYGKKYDVQYAVCMEAQGFPNSPNLPFFPSPVLRPGNKYDEWCIYKFV